MSVNSTEFVLTNIDDIDRMVHCPKFNVCIGVKQGEVYSHLCFSLFILMICYRGLKLQILGTT